MISTKRARRVVAALAVPAFLLTAACGSEDSEDSQGSAQATCEPSSGGGDSSASESAEPGGDGANVGENAPAPVAEVSGEVGASPEVSLGENSEIGDEIASAVVHEGDGDPVAQSDFLRLDVVAKTVSDDQELLNTWASSAQSGDDGGPRQQIVAQAGVESYLPKTVTDHLIGRPVGSRVQIEGLAEDLFGSSAEGYVEPDEGVVWVVDVAAAVSVDLTGEAEGEQADAAEGMPTATDCDQAPAAITMPGNEDPPTGLREQVLIEGDGPVVEAGQALAVQYTGVLWKDGKKFDSSWDRDSASAFQIGTGQVVKGWDEGLVGKHVGDRVLLVIPPDLGYGDEGNESIPPASTLVFVVDILGAA